MHRKLAKKGLILSFNSHIQVFHVKGHQNAYVRTSYDVLSSKVRYYGYSAPLLPINAKKTAQIGAYFEFYLTHIGFFLLT